MDERGTLARLQEALGRLETEVEISTYEPYPDIPTSAAEAAAHRARKVLSGDAVVIEGPDREYDLEPSAQATWLRVKPVSEEARISVALDEAALRDTLAPIAADAARAPEDASLYVDASEEGISRVRVSPGEPGREPRADELLSALTRDLFGGRKSYTLAVDEIEPSRTTAEVEAVKPDRLLGGYTTGYRTGDEDGAPRYATISGAAAALDGTLIPPGGTYSLLEALAGAGIYPEDLRSPEEDYVFDPANPSRPPVDDASGLSQVSSTVYAAALLAGVAVPERSPAPAAPLPYTDPGLEAYLGSADDLVIENDTDSYLYLQVASDGAGGVDARIFGRNPASDGLPARDLSSERIQAAGGATEEWQASRTLSSGQEEALHRDTYTYEPVEPEADDAPPEDPENASGETTGEEADGEAGAREGESGSAAAPEQNADDDPLAGSEDTAGESALETTLEATTPEE